MKPTKMRNLQIYKATLEFRSRQLASPLSKDLRKKYNKRSVRVIEGDTVLVVRGEYKEIVGKVIKSNAAEGTIAIEDIKKEKGKGEKIDVMIHASNVVITSLDTSDKWRRARLEGKKSKNMIVKDPVADDTAGKAKSTVSEASTGETKSTVSDSADGKAKSTVSDSADGKAKSTVSDAKVTKSAKPKEDVQ